MGPLGKGSVSQEAIDATALAFRVVLSLLFLRGGLAKLSDRESFQRAVVNYGLLPPGASKRVAQWLPSVEVLCGALLAVGAGQSIVAVGLAALLAVFTTGIAINLARGRVIDCGCFGPAAPKPINWSTVARNLVLLGMAFTVALRAPPALSIDAAWGQSASVLSTRDALAAFMFATSAYVGQLLIAEFLRLTRSMNASRPERE